MSLMDYERPSLTTDMVLFRVKDNENDNIRKYAEKDLRVLLIERDNEPQMGMWSLPGGFVEIDEEIFDNVKRKLQEKTGVEGDFYVEQLYTWGDVDSIKNAKPHWDLPFFEETLDFKRGVKVNHPHFGNGEVILEVTDTNTGFLTVHFDSVGNKTLSLKYANLKIID
jgi:ADP-ribose pyrophosphatase YjhB (NUDIX family)